MTPVDKWDGLDEMLPRAATSSWPKTLPKGMVPEQAKATRPKRKPRAKRGVPALLRAIAKCA